MTDPGDELVEVVGHRGEVERIVTRREMRSGRLRHRATFIAILDDRGRLLIHRRSPAKDVWPSRWDIAAGGVAAVGESWEAAAERELGEELGLDAPLQRIGGGTYDDQDVATVGVVFVARIDTNRKGEISFADGEIVEARWVSFDELDDLVQHEDFCPDSLDLVLPLIRPADGPPLRQEVRGRQNFGKEASNGSN